MRLVIPVIAAILAGFAPPDATTKGSIPELAGRSAGSPQRCITFSQNESLRIADSHSLIYGTGRTIYLNSNPECSGFRSTDILVLEPIGSKYCRGDFVRTRDSMSGLPGAGCRLGDFVPYTRN